jgi:hypothetical protein
VGLTGLSGHTKVIHIDPTVSFLVRNIEVPSISILMGLTTESELLKNLDDHVDIDANLQLTITSLSGVILLPPYLLDDLMTINSNEISDIYFQTVEFINSWAPMYVETNTAAALKVSRYNTFNPALQWLWACTHNLIDATPFHSSLGPMEQEYKKFMHDSHIHMPPRPLPPEGIIGGHLNTDLYTNQDESLRSSLAKISVLWEQQATEANNKSMSKTPSWERLTQQARNIIL